MNHPLLRVMVVLTFAWVTLPIAAAPSIPATPSYNGARVAAHVQQLSDVIGTRGAGSVGEGRAAGYIAGQFAASGLDVRIQSFPVWVANEPGWSANVIATLPGADPGYGTLYLGAHYDSVDFGIFHSPGANDNAGGVAVLLELARLLAAQPLRATVVFIAFGSEEAGLVGSQAFVRRITGRERVLALGMLNLDCIGVGDRLSISTLPGADPSLRDRALAAAAQHGVTVVDTAGWGRSDQASFVAAGIPAAFFETRGTDGGCGPDYHKPTDTSATLDPANLARAAEIALATAQGVATDAPLRQPSTIWLPLAAAS